MNIKTIVALTGLCLTANAGPIEDLKPGEWYEVPNSRLDQCPERATTAQFPWIKGYFSCITDCWVGGAYDTKRDLMLIGPGGGHSAYNGNEVYGFDINTLKWRRLTDPDPANITYQGQANECTADSVPFALHSYDGVDYMPPPVDRLVVVGGWCTPYTYTLNLDTKKWDQWPAHGTGRTGDLSAYDPVGQRYFYSSGWGGELMEFDPFNHTWTKRFNGASYATYYHNGTVDTKRRQMICVGNGSVLTYGLQSPYAYAKITTAGDTQIVNRGNPGAEYHPGSDRVVAWSSGATVYELDPATKVWTSRVGGGKAPGTAMNGTYGRFRYVPSKDVFVLVTGVSANVFFYRRPGGNTAAEFRGHTAEPFRVFPNPARVGENIRFTGSAALDVFDVAGKRVFSTRKKDAEWTASGLAPGIFFARGRAGGKIVSKKILLQK